MEKNENVPEVNIPQVTFIEEDRCEDVITTKECPFCCETIKAAASRCPYCGESLGQHLHSHLGRPLRWHEFKQKRSSSYFEWIFYSWEWKLESVAIHIKNLAFFEILDYLSRVSVLIAVIFWFLESGERERQAQIQAWQVISFGEQIGGGIVAVQALELLNCTNSFWSCNPVSFEGIKLENTNLPQLNLPSAILNDARLKASNLSTANLTGADLRLADISDADLRSADLSGANLLGANLTGADLTYAEMSGANLTGADLTYAEMSGANLSRAYLSGTNLTRAFLSGANLRNANLRNANLTDADLTYADLSGANLLGANLTGANLRNAEILDAKYNTATRWPFGFDPIPSGAILSEK